MFDSILSQKSKSSAHILNYQAPPVRSLNYQGALCEIFKSLGPACEAEDVHQSGGVAGFRSTFAPFIYASTHLVYVVICLTIVIEMK